MVYKKRTLKKNKLKSRSKSKKNNSKRRRRTIKNKSKKRQVGGKSNKQAYLDKIVDDYHNLYPDREVFLVLTDDLDYLDENIIGGAPKKSQSSKNIPAKSSRTTVTPRNRNTMMTRSMSSNQQAQSQAPAPVLEKVSPMFNRVESYLQTTGTTRTRQISDNDFTSLMKEVIGISNTTSNNKSRDKILNFLRAIKYHFETTIKQDASIYKETGLGLDFAIDEEKGEPLLKFYQKRTVPSDVDGLDLIAQRTQKEYFHMSFHLKKLWQEPTELVSPNSSNKQVTQIQTPANATRLITKPGNLGVLHAVLYSDDVQKHVYPLRTMAFEFGIYENIVQGTPIPPSPPVPPGTPVPPAPPTTIVEECLQVDGYKTYLLKGQKLGDTIKNIKYVIMAINHVLKNKGRDLSQIVYSKPSILSVKGENYDSFDTFISNPNNEGVFNSLLRHIRGGVTIVYGADAFSTTRYKRLEEDVNRIKNTSKSGALKDYQTKTLGFDAFKKKVMTSAFILKLFENSTVSSLGGIDYRITSDYVMKEGELPQKSLSIADRSYRSNAMQVERKLAIPENGSGGIGYRDIIPTGREEYIRKLEGLVSQAVFDSKIKTTNLPEPPN